MSICEGSHHVFFHALCRPRLTCRIWWGTCQPPRRPAAAVPNMELSLGRASRQHACPLCSIRLHQRSLLALLPRGDSCPPCIHPAKRHQPIALAAVLERAGSPAGTAFPCAPHAAALQSPWHPSRYHRLGVPRYRCRWSQYIGPLNKLKISIDQPAGNNGTLEVWSSQNYPPTTNASCVRCELPRAAPSSCLPLASSVGSARRLPVVICERQRCGRQLQMHA